MGYGFGLFAGSCYRQDPSERRNGTRRASGHMSCYPGPKVRGGVPGIREK